ncbi:hypothetical protein D3C83_113780 [compost metagenome]
MAFAYFQQLRLVRLAFLRCDRTARMELAAPWRIDRTRQVALQDDTLTLGFNLRIRNRNGRKKRPSIRMARIIIELAAFRQLNDFA